jgi:CHAD domain-containing protein
MLLLHLNGLMNATAINPIETLRRRGTSLEAAISVALAEPTRKAVHELRSETRRIEAELDLLSHMHGLPSYRPAAAELSRRLRKLRRVAGELRDCDVQLKLLKKSECPETEEGNKRKFEHDRRSLRKCLRKDRSRIETRLRHLLEKQQPKLTRDLEDVLGALKPNESQPAPADHLLDVIERSVEQTIRFRDMDEKQLHAVRKAAKHARYQCETLPGERPAAFAKRLEELQDSGGVWHDLLVLAAKASHNLGSGRELVCHLEQQRDEQLADYLQKLQALRSRRASSRRALSSNGARKPVQNAPIR